MTQTTNMVRSNFISDMVSRVTDVVFPSENQHEHTTPRYDTRSKKQRISKSPPKVRKNPPKKQSPPKNTTKTSSKPKGG